MAITPLTCVKCGLRLETEQLNIGRSSRCLACGAELEVQAFPAATRLPAAEPARRGEALTVADDASCFYHPAKKAAVPCDACGRFLCSLCDIEIGARHLCPACVQSGSGRGGTGTSRFRARDRQALLLAILPLALTALWALYLVVRYYRQPVGLLRRTKVYWLLATVIAVAQLTCWALLLLGSERSL